MTVKCALRWIVCGLLYAIGVTTGLWAMEMTLP